MNFWMFLSTYLLAMGSGVALGMAIVNRMVSKRIDKGISKIGKETYTTIGMMPGDE